MGQYYKPLLITPDGRVLVLSPHEFSSFSKLTEHSWISNPFVNAVFSLIYDSGKRVAWIGDYSEQEYDTCGEAYTKALPFDEFHKYKEAAWGENTDGLPSKLFSARDLNILNSNTKGMFLVNNDKRLYIDMAAYISENTTKGGTWDGWCVNPLPILTACGNGRGGGDFHSGGEGYDDVGIWAFDCLEYTAKTPNGYSEVFFNFREKREAVA